VLLGAADPEALATFDRLHDEGWRERPPHWAGERLLAFREALAAVPDPDAPREGLWRLDDATVEDLTATLPWTRQFASSSLAERRSSVEAEWHTARTLYRFVDEAIGDGLVVIAD
jgi:hypothetical protein